jgi:protoheme IX farnesyltransferase
MIARALTAGRATPADFVEMTKPRITAMVLLTTLVGYVMASGQGASLLQAVPVLVGVALVAAGANTLNMVLERHTDALMRRTARRPLPAGRLRVIEALVFGLALTSAGLTGLLWMSGRWPAALALLTWASYLFIYTPLKTRTSLCTVAGAFPGALPPVIGWAAARGAPEPGAFVLFAILFLWQIPHFLAIAWIYREDYARAGLPMLPVVDPQGLTTGRQAVANSLALLLVSLAPAAGGMAGRAYLVGAVVLGLALTAVAVASAVRRTNGAARALFGASIVYLAALCTLLLVSRH